MNTILDKGYTWFLASLLYEDGLTIQLVEGVRRESPQDLKIGDFIIENTYPIETTEGSKQATVKFAIPVAWQLVDESYTSWDKTEVCDTKGFLQVLSKSQYLDFVNANHGWYKDVAGEASHYRLWTENEVIDVVSHDPPEIA